MHVLTHVSLPPSSSTCTRMARAALRAWVSMLLQSCGCSIACSATVSQPSCDLCLGINNISENSTQVGGGHFARIVAYTSSLPLFSSFTDWLSPQSPILSLGAIEILIRDRHPVFSLTSYIKHNQTVCWGISLLLYTQTDKNNPHLLSFLCASYILFRHLVFLTTPRPGY